MDYKKIDLIEADNKIEYSNIKENKNIYFSICLHSEKFKEYQKNLFNDFYSRILELLDKNSIFLDFKKNIESEIKQFNTKLKIFQEKINIEDKIDIRWTLQIIWGETYLSALIWESSLIIFRENKLESVIANEIEEEDKIDVFWEIIEWELENNDKIISICSNIYNYMTDDEIKETIDNNNILKTFEDILTTRVQKKEIWKLEELDIQIEKIKLNSKKEFNLNKYTDILKKHRYSIGTIIALSIIFFVIFSIFSYLGKDKKQVIEIWWKKIEVNITNLNNLKRQIDAFWKLNFSKENWIAAKKVEYKKIIEELDAFKNNNIQTLEIKNLREKVEKNYYKGFNINLVSENDWLLKNIYSFSNKGLTQLSWINQLFKSHSRLNISWEKWALLWIIDNKYKWILQKIKIPTNIKTCTNNLDWNGIYCATENNDIYNISKYWIITVKNSQWSWPKNIVSIATYGVNKLYILTKDEKLNKEWTYIVKYIVKGKNTFSSPIKYIFTKKSNKNLINSITTGSNMVIDGTFLISGKKWVLQVYRKNRIWNEVIIREIPWWDKAIINDNKDFSGKVKVIGNINSKYIHLFDFATNSIVTYLTSPYKTNSANTNSYKLVYINKIRFIFDNEKIKDVIVNYNSSTRKQTAYVLTNKWIYSIDLGQFQDK